MAMPTTSGFYWRRFSGKESRWHVVEVFEVDGELEEWDERDQAGVPLELGCEWRGPIEEPR